MQQLLIDTTITYTPTKQEAVLDAVRDHPDLGRGRAIVIEHYDKTSAGGEQFALVSSTVTQSATWEILERDEIDRDWPGLADQL